MGTVISHSRGGEGVPEERAGSWEWQLWGDRGLCVFSEKMLHSALGVSLERHPGGNVQQIV